MLRASDLHACTIELELIENQLQKLVEKMKLGTKPAENNRFLHNENSSMRYRVVFLKKKIDCIGVFSFVGQDKQTNRQTDKLRDIMQRCKKLINTILVLDDYVTVDDNITKYIQENLPLLSSTKNLQEHEKLYQRYSNLLENLTVIVDNLQEQLPHGLPLQM